MSGSYQLAAQDLGETVSMEMPASNPLTANPFTAFASTGEIKGSGAKGGALSLTPISDSTVSTAVGGTTSKDAVDWLALLFPQSSSAPPGSSGAGSAPPGG